MDQGWLPSYECSGCKRELKDKLELKRKKTKAVLRHQKQLARVLRMVTTTFKMVINGLPGLPRTHRLHRSFSKIIKNHRKEMRKIHIYILTRK